MLIEAGGCPEYGNKIFPSFGIGTNIENLRRGKVAKSLKSTKATSFSVLLAWNP
jgi:hypothetical protein